MNELSQKYQFELSTPIAAPYQDAQVKNYSYKASRRADDAPCHLVVYKSKKPAQLASYHKKLSKCATISSPYLVPILDCIKDDEGGQLFVVLQWNQSFNFKDCLKEATISEAVAIALIRDVLKGLKDLHQASMLHSFVNIENIEICQGRARLSFRYLIYKTYYLAPEIKENHQKSVESDLFSLGVCLYRLIFGTLPFKQKTQDQYAKSVKKGISKKVAIAKCNYPIYISEQAQEIINSLCQFEPAERERSHQLLEKYQWGVKGEGNQLIEAALGQHYKLIKIQQRKQQITSLLVLSPKQKRVYSMEIIEHNLTELSAYIQEVISPFKNQSNSHLANIKEFFPVLKNSIAIVYSYCGQGSLRNYRKYTQFDGAMVKEVQNLLSVVLRRWVGQYRFLDYDQILIRQGKAVVKFPPYPTKQLKSKLKQSAKGSYFFAPQLDSGVQSQSADSWSAGVLEYWMRFDCFPAFDKEANLLIRDKSKLSPQEIQKLEKLIVIKLKDRHNSFPIDDKTLPDPNRKISFDSSNETQSGIKSSKLKSSLIRLKNKTLTVNKLTNLQDQQGQSEDLQILQINQNVKPVKSEEKRDRKGRQSQPAVKELNVFDRFQGQSYEDQPQNEGRTKQAKRPEKYPPPSPQTAGQRLSAPQLKASSLSEQTTGQPGKRLNRFAVPGQSSAKYSRDNNQMKQRNSVSKISEKSKEEKTRRGLGVGEGKSEKVLEKLKENSWKLSQIETHWTKPIRVLFKCLMVVLLYVLVFYLRFLATGSSLISSRYTYAPLELYLYADKASSSPSINFTLVTRNGTAAYSQLSNQTLDYVLNTAQCITNKYWSSTVMLELIQSSSFATYAVVGIMIVLVNLIMQGLVLAKLDFPKAITCCQLDDNNYAGLYSWLIANLAISTLTSLTFTLYGGIFSLQLDPCLSRTSFPSLQLLFRKDSSGFALKFSWVYVAIILAWMVIGYVSLRAKNKLHKYVYGLLILLYIVSLGLRGLAQYNGTKQAVIGACGEVLVLVIGLILLVFDMVVSCCLRKMPKNAKNGAAITEDLDANITEIDLNLKK